jgi:hypothetical protein
MTRKPISVLVLVVTLITLTANFMPPVSARAAPATPNASRDLDLAFARFDTGDHAFAQPLTSLERLLNADGTLNLTTGFSGSVDVSGWAMRTGSNGAPRFVRTSNTSANAAPLSPGASPDDVNWDGQFDLPGANNTVFALAVSGSNLYVGGTFTTIGTVSANHIASWNNLSGGWTSLANGVDGSVTALIVSGSDLFVGGTFTHACGNATCSSGNLTVNNIAQWNGTASAWSALGSGVNGNVTALAVSGSDLYVGGAFTLASGLTVNHIAQWNGTASAWSALGSGVDNPINALAVSGSDLFVGGAFIQTCGNAACNSGNLIVNHIAQWNGSDWSALGNGVNDNVNALAASGGTLYVGGVFIQACGNAACNSGNLTVNHIAQWNGSIWSALGNGVNDNVTALAASSSRLYAGGAFTQACGNVACNSGNLTINHITQWNGSDWSTLGNGLDNAVLVLAVSGSSLYVGGFFGRTCDNAACNSGSLAASHIAQWNGSIWSALGNGMNRFVKALAVSGNNLYVGGDFTSAGGLTVNHIAQWNGSNWSALGNGVNGDVQALAVSGSNLFVGGSFSQVCGNTACNSGNLTVNNIAQWNGSDWSALGSGVDNPINALVVSGNNLYAGGAFDAVCGNAACNSGNLIVNYVALWSGNNWFALGNGVKGAVLALAMSGTDLYVGGIFSQVCSSAICTSGNLTVNHIALWSSNNWFVLDNGVNGFGVQALAVNGSSLYVGGFFDAVCGNAACNSGNLTVNNLARWDGIAWSALGNGVNSFGVQALAVSGNNLYVGGTFTQACGNAACNNGNLTVNNIAQWNGTASAWSALGSGLDNAVWALAVSERNLYVAGNFSTAGGKPSYFFGRWARPFAVYLPIIIR